MELVSKVDGKKTRPEKPGQKRFLHKFIRRVLVPKYLDTLWGRTKPGEGSSSTDSYVQ